MQDATPGSSLTGKRTAAGNRAPIVAAAIAGTVCFVVGILIGGFALGDDTATPPPVSASADAGPPLVWYVDGQHTLNEALGLDARNCDRDLGVRVATAARTQAIN